MIKVILIFIFTTVIANADEFHFINVTASTCQDIDRKIELLIENLDSTLAKEGIVRDSYRGYEVSNCEEKSINLFQDGSPYCYFSSVLKLKLENNWKLKSHRIRNIAWQKIKNIEDDSFRKKVSNLDFVELFLGTNYAKEDIAYTTFVIEIGDNNPSDLYERFVVVLKN